MVLMLSRAFRWLLPALMIGLMLSGSTLLAKDGKPVAGPKELDDYDVADLRVGGPFTLTDQDGKPHSLVQMHGKVVLMFFGYTYCPDVCPLSMTKITGVQKQLGAQGANTQAVFITVDPARDTPARMKSSVENFPGKALGLTGNDAQIAQVAKLFRTKYRKGEERSATDYLMAHTAYLSAGPQGDGAVHVPAGCGRCLACQRHPMVADPLMPARAEYCSPALALGAVLALAAADVAATGKSPGVRSCFRNIAPRVTVRRVLGRTRRDPGAPSIRYGRVIAPALDGRGHCSDYPRGRS